MVRQNTAIRNLRLKTPPHTTRISSLKFVLQRHAEPNLTLKYTFSIKFGEALHCTVIQIRVVWGGIAYCGVLPTKFDDYLVLYI